MSYLVIPNYPTKKQQRKYPHYTMRIGELISSFLLLIRLSQDAKMSAHPTLIDSQSIPLGYVLQVLILLEEEGIDRMDTLSSTGLNVNFVDKTDTLVSPRQFILLLNNCAKLLNDPSVGYRLGLRLKPSVHGMLGFALMTCTNIREAILLGCRFMSLRTDALSIHFSEEEHFGILEIKELLHLGPDREIVIEFITSAILSMARFLNVQVLDSTEIWVDYPEPAYYETKKLILPKVCFDMQTVQIRFSYDALDKPIALSDVLSKKSAVAQLEAELSAKEVIPDIVVRIKSLINCLRGDFPSLSNAANSLNISISTLKRRLQQRSYKYQELLDESRQSCATSMLKNKSTSIELIATTLGYSDCASFTRAFKKWTGTSPTSWRKNNS